jgi:ATP-binding cassette subfamily B (MDR/TAP) protein 9
VTALVVFYGGLMVRNGDMTSGKLVSFLLYLQSLSDAFSSIGYIFSSLTQAVGAADKVFELMNRKPRLRTPTVMTDSARNVSSSGRVLNIDVRQTQQQRTRGLEPDSCRGEIVLKDVEMYYPARPQRRILKGLTLTIPPGKIVALVGQSGGGKSSVISLLQHLYEQSAGKVMIDGHEVHELSPRWLSRHISIVSQEPVLFGRSIKRNIMYGLEGTEWEPSQEEIERVARLANADVFIEEMPQKYDTEVGERGVQLSGGQKQRICIARALIRKPKILLLDEATSALDTLSEEKVQNAIDHMLASGRGDDGNPAMSVLIVAHRLSTIKNADIIFVIGDGNVVEQGNHSELIQNPDGAYSALIKCQMDAQKKLEDGKKDPDESLHETAF